MHRDDSNSYNDWRYQRQSYRTIPLSECNSNNQHIWYKSPGNQELTPENREKMKKQGAYIYGDSRFWWHPACSKGDLQYIHPRRLYC